MSPALRILDQAELNVSQDLTWQCADLFGNHLGFDKFKPDNIVYHRHCGTILLSSMAVNLQVLGMLPNNKRQGEGGLKLNGFVASSRASI